MNRDGQRLSGVKQFLGQIPSRIPFIRQVLDYTGKTSLRVTGEEATSDIEQTPIDEDAAVVEFYDTSGVAAELLAEVIKIPGKTTIPQLPDLLSSVSVSFNKNGADGANSHPQSQQGFVITGYGSATANPKASAQASASILPVVSWVIVSVRNRLVNCTHLYFYLAQSTDLTAILAKCTTIMGATVTDLPVFKAKSHQVISKGQQISIQANADTTVSFSISQGPSGSTNKTKAYEYGNGSSVDSGVTIHVDTIPETIHGSITIASNTDSKTVTATVVADAAAVTGDSGTEIAAKVNSPTATSGTASASAVFENGTDSVGATTPSTYPTSNLSLVDLSSESDSKFGYTKIHAVIVDMSQYA